ncbi:MAG: DUF2304 domain-containing protein [Faecalicoccus sp.]|nr:DUF2304 domain-containing protein [Faecalicoccus sp.]
MSFWLRIALLFVSLFLYTLTFILLKKDKLPLNYALVWGIPATVLLILFFLPSWILKIQHWLGFQTTSNFVVGILFVVLICTSMSLTVIVSTLTSKSTLLIQELSMLKKRVEDLENKE